MEILRIDWGTGHMDLIVKIFFPCPLQVARKIVSLINRYCAEEDRVALLLELRGMVEFYQQGIQEDKDAHERLRRHCVSMGSMAKPEELKAMKCCEIRIRKNEALKKRVERNIKLIEGGKKK